jgi:hypothetical protein
MASKGCLRNIHCTSNSHFIRSESEALQVLADLRSKGNKNDPVVLLEYEEIKEQVRYEHAEGAKSYLDLFRYGNPRRAMLGMSLHMWGQLSGVNVMM